MNPERPAPTFGGLTALLAQETYDQSAERNFPFYFLSGKLFYYWFSFADLGDWSVKVSRTLNSNEHRWFERTHAVTAALAGPGRLERIADTAQAAGVPFTTAMSKLLADDFVECHKIDENAEIDWPMIAHAKAVGYLSLFGLSLWVQDRGAAYRFSEAAKSP